ncbi:unnamed protein product [Closterium sp. NIES-54]
MILSPLSFPHHSSFPSRLPLPPIPPNPFSTSPLYPSLLSPSHSALPTACRGNSPPDARGLPAPRKAPLGLDACPSAASPAPADPPARLPAPTTAEIPPFIAAPAAPSATAAILTLPAKVRAPAAWRGTADDAMRASAVGTAAGW